MILRPCLGLPGVRCGRLIKTGRRCAEHAPLHEKTRRPSTTARGYGAAWQDYSRQQVAEEPWCHATPCRWADTAGTPANPLTTDHATLGLVLCRNDNVAKAHADRAARRRGVGSARELG